MTEERNDTHYSSNLAITHTLTIDKNFLGKHFLDPCSMKLCPSDVVDVVNSTDYDVEIREFRRRNTQVGLLENPDDPTEYPLIIESGATKTYRVIRGSAGGSYKYKAKLINGPAIKECRGEPSPCNDVDFEKRRKKKRATVDPEMIVE